MKVLAAVFLLIMLVLMSAESPAKKLLTKGTKKAVVGKFLTSGHSERNVRHNWLTVRQWALFINKYLPIKGHAVQTDDIHESIRRDPRLRDLDLEGSQNDAGIYRNRITTTSGKRVWCYQYRGLDSTGKAYPRKDAPVAVGAQWTDRLYNPFTMTLGAWPEDDSESEG